MIVEKIDKIIETRKSIYMTLDDYCLFMEELQIDPIETKDVMYRGFKIIVLNEITEPERY